MRQILILISILGFSGPSLGQERDSSIFWENINNNENFFRIEFSQEEFVNAKTKSIIKDGSEDQTIDSLFSDPSENSPNKRVLNGPSQYDSRIELRNLNPTIEREGKILGNSRSVAIIIEKELLHEVTDTLYQIDVSSTLGMKYNLCPGEAFREQPVAGMGSAFIVDEDLMATASHVFEGPIENYVVVFGFEMFNQTGAFESFIPVNDIYYPKSVSFSSDELDVTLFKVDRIFDREALKLSNSLSLPANEAIYMIGHPMGLPKKVALNASVLENKDPYSFYTTLDAFQGNSGSPVFRLNTHEVIGILVSGEIDYKWNGSCNASTLCSAPYCKGEKVIRIEEITKELETE